MKPTGRLKYQAAVAAIIILGSSMAAEAKPARCYTSDDGNYNCNFFSVDRRGSFTIRAAGKPTFTLYVDEPGVATVSADFGTGRNVPLPGVFYRRGDDPACWSNSDTNTTLCAW